MSQPLPSWTAVILAVLLAALGPSVTSSAPERPGPTAVRQPPVFAPLSDSAAWAAGLSARYRVTPGITYFTADNWQAKLDVYQPLGAAPRPTLIYFHGGGWNAGLDRTRLFLHTLPYFEMGWGVVNVDFRVTTVARAPAAVEDTRCALRWVTVNGAAYNLDVKRIVVSGMSSGGHLALMTGMAPAAAGFDEQCPPCMQWNCRTDEEMPVAAIVNWFGVTDVLDLLRGPNARVSALSWVGGTPDRAELARRVSPLTYVRPGLPPVFTVHGSLDPSVPYAQATRLHDALTEARVPNRLHTIEKGNHGGFSMPEYVGIHAAIRAFLAEQRLIPAAAR